MEAFAIQLAEMDSLAAHRSALICRQTAHIAVVVMRLLALLVRLVKTEFAQDAILHVPKENLAAKEEPHVARYVVMTTAALILIIVVKAIYVPHVNAPNLEQLVAVQIVATQD